MDYPKDPWWTVPGFGALASIFVLGVNLREHSNMPDWAGTLPMALVAACACGYALWQRRRRGTMPSGKAPREINRILWGFVLGAVVVVVAMFLLANLAPLWLAVPCAFVLASGGMLWFGHAYDRAATQVRERST